ncbi:E3 ubiquitin-protein ligase UPL1-like [Tasmannia lanceolata]|uniref:E3 ubiquitin-protein ligase UPL1-like n=1 Tax=Tasmannia lanceolata TaxID=3420 RepID=UPI004063D6B5
MHNILLNRCQSKKNSYRRQMTYRLSDYTYGLVAEALKKLVAIAPIHCHLFINALAVSVKKLCKSAMSELHSFGEAEKALLSTSSTDGNAILRVLQALISLIASLLEKKVPQLLPLKEYNDNLSQVWDINAFLELLWMKLNFCTSKIESCSDSASDFSTVYGCSASTSIGVIDRLPAGTQNIFPYIERFFVTCERSHPRQSVVGHDFSTVKTFDVEDATNSGMRKLSVSHEKADDKLIAFV